MTHPDAGERADLEGNEERLRQAVRVAQLGIYDHDQVADVLYWSPRQREMFGLGPDEPVNVQVFVDCVHPEDRDRVATEVRRAHDPSGDGAFDIEYRIVRRDGEVRWLSNRGLTTFAGTGTSRRPVRSVGAVIDVTERRRAEDERSSLEAQLAHARRVETVGRLASGVAHDFNNVLHVILGFTQVLRRKLPPGSQVAEYVAEIERAAGRAQDVTRQLLGFSRKQAFSPCPCDLNRLVAATSGALARLVGDEVELRVRVGAGLWTVNVDPAQVDQILMNLVVNARDAMPRGGRLTIETANAEVDEAFCRDHPGARPGQYAAVGVSDEGVGMDEDTLARAFEPFFTTKPTGRGTGLGLATVEGIVAQNRGFITVESAPGRGTTFRVHFPRLAGEAGRR